MHAARAGVAPTMAKKAKNKSEQKSSSATEIVAPFASTKKPASNTNRTEKNTQNEIDDLFAAKKHKSVPTVPPVGVPEKKFSKKDIAFFDTRGLKSAARTYTDDGFVIYTAEELGLSRRDNSGKDHFLPLGNTPDCPFDCECCV